MICKYSSFVKRIIILLLMTIVFCFSGCNNKDEIIMPTQAVPTPQITTEPTQNIQVPPTPTMNTDEIVIFNDLNLEKVVREIIGKNIGNITFSDVEGITTLSARVRGISNIEVLKYFTNLEVLDLYGNRVSDLTSLTGLTNLKKLNLGKNYNVLTSNQAVAGGLDISSLKGIVNLEELNLSDNMIVDISSLGSLTKLQTLFLNNNRIDNISALSGCVSLKYIDLSNNYGLNSDNTERGITDLSPLYNACAIEFLICTNNLVSDVQGIEKMKSLQYVDLTKNYIQSVESFAKLPNLKNLILSTNLITSIDLLANNTTITFLDVSSNIIANFECIKTMSALNKLIWENNNIEDYTPIEEFELEKNGVVLFPEVENEQR